MSLNHDALPTITRCAQCKQEMRGGQYYYSWDLEHRCCSRVCLQRFNKTGKTYRPDGPPEAA